jgi:hypothetical protein
LAAGPGTFQMADEPAAKKGPPPKAAPAPEPKKSRFDEDEEDEESVRRGYGVIGETEAEKKEAEKNRPKFTEVQDKFKKSARGPAQALLVMPSNLLTLEGILTVVAGMVYFMVGMWPLVFNDAPPGEEELEEAIIAMLIGMFVMVWGGIVCYGASQMQELASYVWAWVGAVMGLVPLLVGAFGIAMLLNPKVKAGFTEMEGLTEEGDGTDDEGDDEDEDEDEEEDEDDEDGGPTAKVGRKLLGRVLSGEDEDEDEDEEPREKRKKRRTAEDDE